MHTIINNLNIDFSTEDNFTLELSDAISINELYYEIEHNKDDAGTIMFMDVVDGKEKFISLTLDKSGKKQSLLNPPNIFKTENFEVEKIVFNCFRKIQFTFSLKKII